MIFEYACYLSKGEVKDPSASEQWAGQYNLHVAVGSKKQADSLREAWKSQYLHNGQAPGETLASQEWQTKLWLCPSPETLPALSSLPVYSFVVHFRFTLQKPYLSRDDNDWHIIDNPLVRDKVFRWPMVRPSGWKGGLLSALWQLGYQQDDGQIQRIFGETRDDDAGRAGRLHLYPTFFNQSGLEIINPHDRERRVGKNPILLESVPIGATGAFTVLYVPFDRIGEEAQETRREVAKDLKLIAEGIGAMMTTYGFGAKASSGFGLAADALREGCLQVAGLDAAEEARQGAPVAQPQRNLPRYLSASGKLHPDFRAAHGVLISEAEYRQKIERRGQKYAKKDKQLYDKAKAWWEREGKALLEQVAPQPEPTMVQPPSRSPVAKRSFANWSELQTQAAELADRLTGGSA